MKKIIKVISLFLIIVVFGEVSYASEYLNNEIGRASCRERV